MRVSFEKFQGSLKSEARVLRHDRKYLATANADQYFGKTICKPFLCDLSFTFNSLPWNFLRWFLSIDWPNIFLFCAFNSTDFVKRT